MIVMLLASFFIYSFIGWFYESFLCSPVLQHKVINRGFLNGPYCPIYGAGAVLDWLFLHQFSNPVLIFFLGMIVASIVEYLTSYAMEKLFHARWWDYSDFPLNLNGRICAYGALIFGVGSVAMVKLSQPALIQLLERISLELLTNVTAVITILFILDTIVTSCSMVDFNARLERIAELVSATKEKDIIRILQSRGRALQHNQRRIMKAFPKMTSITDIRLLDSVRQIILDTKSKIDSL